MRRRPGNRELYGKQVRRTMQRCSPERGHVRHQADAERALDASCAALTVGIFGYVNGLFGLRIKSGRPVTGGKMGVSVRARFHRARAFGPLCHTTIGRAGDGKGKHGKAGKKRAHVM